jgi:hypothetical protein
MGKGTGILLNPATLDLQMEVERDSSGLITQGLAIGDTLYQNQALILQTGKGEYKEHPTLGVDIAAMVNDDDLVGWKREISLQLESDGMRVDKLEITRKKLVIDANYIKK